jgi:hypothetical protein
MRMIEERHCAIPTTGNYAGLGRTCFPDHLFWDHRHQKERRRPFGPEFNFNRHNTGLPFSDVHARGLVNQERIEPIIGNASIIFVVAWDSGPVSKLLESFLAAHDNAVDR